MTTSFAGFRERLANAERMLKHYTTLQATGTFNGPECPAVVAHEIKNWQLQRDLLHLAMETV